MAEPTSTLTKERMDALLAAKKLTQARYDAWAKRNQVKAPEVVATVDYGPPTLGAARERRIEEQRFPEPPLVPAHAEALRRAEHDARFGTRLEAYRDLMSALGVTEGKLLPGQYETIKGEAEAKMLPAQVDPRVGPTKSEALMLAIQRKRQQDEPLMTEVAETRGVPAWDVAGDIAKGLTTGIGEDVGKRLYPLISGGSGLPDESYLFRNLRGLGAPSQVVEVPANRAVEWLAEHLPDPGKPVQRAIRNIPLIPEVAAGGLKVGDIIPFSGTDYAAAQKKIRAGQVKGASDFTPGDRAEAGALDDAFLDAAGRVYDGWGLPDDFHAAAKEAGARPQGQRLAYVEGMAASFLVDPFLAASKLTGVVKGTAGTARRAVQVTGDWLDAVPTIAGATGIAKRAAAAIAEAGNAGAGTLAAKVDRLRRSPGLAAKVESELAEYGKSLDGIVSSLRTPTADVAAALDDVPTVAPRPVTGATIPPQPGPVYPGGAASRLPPPSPGADMPEHEIQRQIYLAIQRQKEPPEVQRLRAENLAAESAAEEAALRRKYGPAGTTMVPDVVHGRPPVKAKPLAPAPASSPPVAPPPPKLSLVDEITEAAEELRDALEDAPIRKPMTAAPKAPAPAAGPVLPPPRAGITLAPMPSPRVDEARALVRAPEGPTVRYAGPDDAPDEPLYELMGDKGVTMAFRGTLDEAMDEVVKRQDLADFVVRGTRRIFGWRKTPTRTGARPRQKGLKTPEGPQTVEPGLAAHHYDAGAKEAARVEARAAAGGAWHKETARGIEAFLGDALRDNPRIAARWEEIFRFAKDEEGSTIIERALLPIGISLLALQRTLRARNLFARTKGVHPDVELLAAIIERNVRGASPPRGAKFRGGQYFAPPVARQIDADVAAQVKAAGPDGLRKMAPGFGIDPKAFTPAQVDQQVTEALYQVAARKSAEASKAVRESGWFWDRVLAPVLRGTGARDVFKSATGDLISLGERMAMPQSLRIALSMGDAPMRGVVYDAPAVLKRAQALARDPNLPAADVIAQLVANEVGVPPSAVAWVRKQGDAEWTGEGVDEAARLLDDVLRSLIGTRQSESAGVDLALEAMRSDNDLPKLYRALFDKGLDAPEVQDFARLIGNTQKLVGSEAAAAGFVGRRLLAGRRSAMAESLVRMGLAVPPGKQSTAIKAALQRLLQGGVAPATPEGAVAEGIWRRIGAPTTGAKVTFIPGTQTFVPDYIADVVQQAGAEILTDIDLPRSFLATLGGVPSVITKMYVNGRGIFARPGAILGNFLGNPLLEAYSTGKVSTPSMQALKLAMATHGSRLDVKVPGMVATPDGGVPLQDVLAAFRRHGLDQTPGYERTQRLLDEIGAEVSPTRSKLGAFWRTVTRNKLAKVVLTGDGVALALNVVDANSRFTTMISHLKAGKTLDEAAVLAREALLDTSTMLPIERGILRYLTPYYTYLRSEAVAGMKNLANPSRWGRLGKGARFMEQSPGVFADPDLHDDKTANKLILGTWEPEGEEGAIEAVTTASIAPSVLLEVMSDPAAYLAPGVNLFSQATGIKELAIPPEGVPTDPMAHQFTVPRSLVEDPLIGDWLIHHFGIAPRAIGRFDQPGLATTEFEGTPARFVVGEAWGSDTTAAKEARSAWLLVRGVTGPVSRVLVGLADLYGTDEHARGRQRPLPARVARVLLGSPPVTIETPEKKKRREAEQQTREFNEAAEAARKAP
jgi:hypothetical protein